MSPTPAADADAHVQERLEAADHVFDEVFRERYPFLWLATLLGPFVVTAVVLAVLYVTAGIEFVVRVLLAAVATFFFFGRFIILGGSDAAAADGSAFLTAGQLFLLVVYLDMATASLLAFHTGFLYRIPLLGPKLRALVEDGQFILQSNPWMRRATFVGLVAFVMFPLAATGSVGGSIFGRLLGLSRALTFAGIALGSLLGCGVMYLGGDLIRPYLDRDNSVLTVGGILCVAAIILLLNYRYRQLKARYQSETARRPQCAAPPTRSTSRDEPVTGTVVLPEP